MKVDIFAIADRQSSELEPEPKPNKHPQPNGGATIFPTKEVKHFLAILGILWSNVE